MKVYSIGREGGCNIVINDRTDVVSRRHAILNVSSNGKMTIVDQSQNGTYVNGMRIASNVPFPVTRKDSVSFAHVARLDWSLVPNPLSYLRYVAIGVIALIVIVGAAWGIYYMNNLKQSNTKTEIVTDAAADKKVDEEATNKATSDSIAKAEAEQESIAADEAENKAKADADKKAKADADKKAKADADKKAKADADKKAKTEAEKKDKAETEKKEQETQTRLRI